MLRPRNLAIDVIEETGIDVLGHSMESQTSYRITEEDRRRLIKKIAKSITN